MEYGEYTSECTNQKKINYTIPSFTDAIRQAPPSVQLFAHSWTPKLFLRAFQTSLVPLLKRFSSKTWLIIVVSTAKRLSQTFLAPKLSPSSNCVILSYFTFRISFRLIPVLSNLAHFTFIDMVNHEKELVCILPGPKAVHIVAAQF